LPARFGSLLGFNRKQPGVAVLPSFQGLLELVVAFPKAPVARASQSAPPGKKR